MLSSYSYLANTGNRTMDLGGVVDLFTQEVEITSTEIKKKKKLQKGLL